MSLPRRPRGTAASHSRCPAHPFPGPAGYNWPDDNRPSWYCRVLVRMDDGEQVTGSPAVLPETFTALPSTLPRIRQRPLAMAARMLEREAACPASHSHGQNVFVNVATVAAELY
jgi:hypothetical protein